VGAVRLRMNEGPMVHRRLCLACLLSLSVVLCLLVPASGQTSVPAQNADVNEDGIVDSADLSLVQSNLGKRCNQSGFNPRADVNRDCVVNVSDVALVSRNLGQKFPPTIAATPSPAANANGWQNGNVTVSFACTGTTSCPSPVVVTTEGAGQAIDRTVSNAGGSATAHVVLNIDKTAPVVVFTSPAANSSTPTSPVAVAGTLSAGGSPIVSAACNGVAATLNNLAFTCGVPLTIVGSNQIAATATDAAGNTGSATLNVVYQPPSAPTIVGSISPPPNSAGWNNTNVTINFTCTNATTCQTPINVSTEGANQVFQGTASGAGGTVTAQVKVDLDRTPPVVTAMPSPSANANGWNNSLVTVTFAATDSLSGVLAGSLTAPITLSTDGVNQSASGQATDVAGNVGTVTRAGISIDTITPVVLFTSPADNSSTPTSPILVQGSFSAGGSPVTSATCTGVAATISGQEFTCTVPLPTTGPNQINAAVTDAAGNTGAAALNVNYQLSNAPTITGAISPAPNAAGWNKTNVTITFTCTNATTCQAPINVSAEGANQVFQGTSTGPGGTAATQITVNLDKTSPVEALTVAPPSTIAPGDTVALSVNASDNIGVAAVVFSVDGTVVTTRTSEPFDFSFAIPVDAVLGTTSVFSVAARDAAGNSIAISQPVSITRLSELTLHVEPPVSPTYHTSAALTGSVGGASGPTTVTVAGGASAASQRLANGQNQFGLDAPLRPNAENVLTVTATDATGQTASASDLRVIQLSLSSLVTAQVTVQRLTTPQVLALVANGTISLSDPANFNVSTFSLSLNVAGRPAPVTVPVYVIKPVNELLAIGPAITLTCGAPDSDITETANGFSIPCDNKDTLPKLSPIKIVPFEIGFPEDAPAPIAHAPTVSGVILLEGQIKTLKEFFKATLLLTNVSSNFTLAGLSAKITIPDSGLSPVAPASGTITMDDLVAGAQGSGQFIIRGDLIGTHTITVNFGGKVTGGGLTTPVPFSGSASTTVEVLGPPNLNVTVEHPDEVTAGVPYTLTVNIQDTSTIDALFASLELDLAGADLIDPTTGSPFTGANVASLGNILAGETVSQSYTVVPHSSGPITSCVGGATINIKLSVVFSGNGGPNCAIGTLPSQLVSASGQPTVMVLPAPNTTNVPLNATISAFFSDAIQTQTLTLGSSGTFRLADDTGALVGGQLQFAPLTNGATAAVFRPSAPLKASATYTIFISPDIFDAKGAHLASGITSSFTTAPPPPADTTPPHVTVQIQPPANPSAVPEGQLVRVLVNSSDDSGVVARLELQIDGELVDARGPVSSVTFLVDTSDFDPGSSHALTVVAIDPSGNTASESMNISILGDLNPPTVSLTAATRVVRGQTLPVSIQANDDVVVKRVDVFFDGGADPIYSGAIAPYHFDINTTSLENGSHQLFALVTDGGGNTAQAALAFSTVSVTSLAISPTPVTVVGIGATQALVVTGTFSDGSVAPITSGLTFLSSDPTRVAVSPSGVVTAIAPGTATIASAVQAPTPLLATAGVTVMAGQPATLALVSGDQQKALVGQAVAAPFIVRATDGNGLPVPGVSVTFQTVTGGGELNAGTATTDSQGRASATLTLGAAPGSNTVTATAGALAGSPVTFHARGISNQPPTLANPGNQSSMQGTVVSLQLTGSDPNGDPLSYSATGLPSGIGINGATGVIAGTLSATAGGFPVTITASNGTLSGSQVFTWNVTAPLTPYVDLAVALSASPTVDAIGGSVIYTLTVSNLGSALATGVVATDVLPAALVFVSASEGCAKAGTTISCTNGTLGSGQVATHTISAVPYTPGAITNSASVTGAQVDVASINNTASATITVVASPPGAPGLSPTGAAEVFTPTSASWTPTGAMSIPRGGATLTVLGDGTVLVLGGINASTAPASAVVTGEIYNPSTGAWTATASLSAPRAFHTATLLPTGDVLITGGVDGSGNAVLTSEVYRGPTIQRVAPIIAWQTPTSIVHGTSLGAPQLNATASVPGTFVYSPPAGTLLSVGSHTLSLTFVPTDQAHYTTVQATVQLAVTP
jgi:uncharacterized repeat protein (TIGR01451 family)